MKYFENEPRFKGVYSKNTLPEQDEGAYVINLENDTKAGSHWIALYIKRNKAIYFDSFGVEHIPIEISKFIENLSTIEKNIYRIQSYDSIMCGYYCYIVTGGNKNKNMFRPDTRHSSR